MPLNRETMYSINNEEYIDCRHMQNDKIVLENPHKGWYYHFVDNGFYNPKYRDDFSADTERLDAQGINHLYIRFDWCDIEKQEGVYEWSCIDSIIGRYAKNGYKFSLRLCTFEGLGKEYAVPEWLAAKGINGTICRKNDRAAFEPDYGDETYLKYLEKFMAEYGRKFNGNPLIEYIDIGTMGTWGEGHTYGGSQKLFSTDVIKKHIDLHLKYFPDTLIMLNDDMINHVSLSDKDAASEIYDYCRGRNLGLRDDGVCVKVFCEDFGFSTLRSPSFFDDFSKNAPIDLELEHYSVCGPERFKDGYRFYEAMKEAHATFAGFHGHLSKWIAEHEEFHNHCANKLGYWYFIEGLCIPELVSGTRCGAYVRVKNKGFSKAYHRFDTKIRLIGESECFVLNSESPDNRRWEADGIYDENIVLDCRGVPSGRYKLQIGMFEGNNPIKLGFDLKYLDADGYYTVCVTDVRKLSV